MHVGAGGPCAGHRRQGVRRGGGGEDGEAVLALRRRAVEAVRGRSVERELRDRREAVCLLGRPAFRCVDDLDVVQALRPLAGGADRHDGAGAEPLDLGCDRVVDRVVRGSSDGASPGAVDAAGDSGLSSSGAPAATATDAARAWAAASPAGATTTTGELVHSAREVEVARPEAPPPSTCTPLGRASCAAGSAVALAEGAGRAVSSAAPPVQAVSARTGTSRRACARDMEPLEGCGGARADPVRAAPG